MYYTMAHLPIHFMHMQLSEEAKKALLNYRKQKPDTITFEIYTNFQQLVKMSQTVSDK